jgi:hypothetical protein
MGNPQAIKDGGKVQPEELQSRNECRPRQPAQAILTRSLRAIMVAAKTWLEQTS